MNMPCVTAILFGLIGSIGSASATIITPLDAVLNANATSSAGTVIAAPVIVGASYGQFSNSANSWAPQHEANDSAGASIELTMQPDYLSLIAWSGVSKGVGYYGGHAGVDALVNFTASTPSDWLLHFSGAGWGFGSVGGYVSLTDSDGAVIYADRCGGYGNACEFHPDVQFSLESGRYSLAFLTGSDLYWGGQSGGQMWASLRPVPNAVPVPASFGPFGADLFMFGLICAIGVLRPARYLRRARA